MLENAVSHLMIVFVSLFPLVNPFGAVPVFCSLTSADDIKRRKKIALKTSINVFIILVVFLLVGNFVLEFFDISLSVLKIAGGLIVAHTAWDMVTGKQKLSSEERSEVESKEDISFTPMAMPLLSGPGSIGVVIGLSGKNMPAENYIGYIIGVLLIAVSCYVILLLSISLLKYLGKTGIGVLNRIMGFFILAIAVQLIVTGLKTNIF